MVVVVLIVVGVLALASGAAGVWGIRRQIAQSGRVTGVPLTRLEFFSWGIRLRGSSRPVRWLIAPWEARYEELATAQLVSSAWTGIRFAVTGSTDAVVFLSFKSSAEILDELEARGVCVDRSMKSIRQAGGTHRTR